MADVEELIGAVDRQVYSVLRDGAPAKVVQARRDYRADLADVWDACTNAERLPRWFLPISGDLRPGGRFQFEGQAGGTIERCEAPSLLAVTWEYGGEISWVEVQLSRSQQGTALQLTHTAPLAADRWAEFGPGAVGVGWDTTLYGLGLHLESGEALDPVAAQAWMASPEGIDFVTAASRQWGSASIAAGETPAVAEAAAERTTAAYTNVEA
jgi:uncharacterized protein YndB with AHSA1/START domain